MSITLQRVIDAVQQESLYFQSQVRPRAPVSELLRQKRQREELADSLSKSEEIQNAFLRMEKAAHNTKESVQLTAEQKAREGTSVSAVGSTGDSVTAEEDAHEIHPTTALGAFIRRAKKVPKTEPRPNSTTLDKASGVDSLQHRTHENVHFPIPMKSTVLDDEADDEDFGPTLPLTLTRREHQELSSEQSTVSAARGAGASLPATNTVHPSQMTKEEYLAQYSRVPRRGESGYTPEQIDEAAKLGYVMSGSRNKQVQKYIDGLQKQLHERQAGKLRLEFLSEKERRLDSSMVEACLKLAGEGSRLGTS